MPLESALEQLSVRDRAEEVDAEPRLEVEARDVVAAEEDLLADDEARVEDARAVAQEEEVGREVDRAQRAAKNFAKPSTRARRPVLVEMSTSIERNSNAWMPGWNGPKRARGARAPRRADERALLRALVLVLDHAPALRVAVHLRELGHVDVADQLRHERDELARVERAVAARVDAANDSSSVSRSMPRRARACRPRAGRASRARRRRHRAACISRGSARRRAPSSPRPWAAAAELVAERERPRGARYGPSCWPTARRAARCGRDELARFGEQIVRRVGGAAICVALTRMGETRRLARDPRSRGRPRARRAESDALGFERAIVEALLSTSTPRASAVLAAIARRCRGPRRSAGRGAAWEGDRRREASRSFWHGNTGRRNVVRVDAGRA